MEHKAIIFDLDGTITDTEVIWELATKKVIESYGITISRADKEHITKELHGTSLHVATTFLKMFFKLEKSVEELMQEKAAIANTLFKKHLKFIDGFSSFHTNIATQGYKTAIATNATEQALKITDKALNLKNFFGTHMYCMKHVNNLSKPNPAVYLYAAGQLGILPKNCIAIEDSPHGVTAAKEAGMKCIAINTAKRRESLSHADIIVERYNQIEL